MNKRSIYANDWMALHPYQAAQPSDAFYVDLSNHLFDVCEMPQLPEVFRKKACLYIAAYLEDIVSGLGLWKAFTQEQKQLYGTTLPFYETGDNYYPDEVNMEDICFLLWNTWEKALYKHSYIHPMEEAIRTTAQRMLPILEEAYETTPENDFLQGYFDSFKDEADGLKKLNWLFGHTYLTEPSTQAYIEQVTPKDRFIIPVGPHALFLHEWIERLAADGSVWKTLKELYPPTPTIPASQLQKNKEIYQLFTAGTGGSDIVYLDGYDNLRAFLTGVLKWQDDDNHTLPHMKAHRNFILMVNEEKGILLAKDICECIAAPGNSLYSQETASKYAFRLLTEPTVCPPDLLYRCIREKWLPDACIPGKESTDIVQKHADFIARHALLYYYRGD